MFLITEFFTKTFSNNKKKKDSIDLASVGNTVFHINDSAKKFKYTSLFPKAIFNLSGGNPLNVLPVHP